MKQYLVRYLLENADNALAKKYIDFFKIELDWHIYNGDIHISQDYHRNKKKDVRKQIVDLLQYTRAAISGGKIADSSERSILSTISFPYPNPLESIGFQLFTPIWHPIGRKNVFGDLKTVKWHLKVQDLIKRKDFRAFLESDLHQELENFQQYLLAEYQKQDFKALFLYTDQYFYSKYNIDIFKKMQRPSFIFSHGLPGIYSKEVDNRANYLLVWGDKIKQHYVDAGFDEGKVKVVGNYKYRQKPREQSLKSNLSNILVIPVSSSIYHQHRYDETTIVDKSLVIIYLYQVQTVLKKFGVKNARYRAHPSVNKHWVDKFLDHDFYIQDNEPLNISLEKSSLCIGATSSLLFESLLHGVNYIVYEPKDDNDKYMTGDKIVPPFDGTEKKLMVANSEVELEKMLRFNAMTDYSIIHDYIQDLDLTILDKLID